LRILIRLDRQDPIRQNDRFVEPFYGLEKPVFDKSWKMPDIEMVKTVAALRTAPCRAATR
jgi:hypothetical protein